MVTVWKLVAFISPLMFVLGVQRSTRPTVNLLASHFSASQQEAAVTVAVLTATYPLGHIVYGWLNQVRPVSPAFQKVWRGFVQNVQPVYGCVIIEKSDC